MIRTFCYKLKPTQAQAAWMLDILERLQDLQNSALNGRKVVYETGERTLGFNEQAKELTLARRRNTYYSDVPQDFQQHVSYSALTKHFRDSSGVSTREKRKAAKLRLAGDSASNNYRCLTH